MTADEQDAIAKLWQLLKPQTHEQALQIAALVIVAAQQNPAPLEYVI